ncbi:MAG: Hsp20/alpha crystallin family protein [Burkholderiaceae bacterium]
MPGTRPVAGHRGLEPGDTCPYIGGDGAKINLAGQAGFSPGGSGKAAVSNSVPAARASDIPDDSDKLNVYARERFAGSFRRVVSLSDDVDSARVDALYRNGVLRIVIPKREASKPRRIDVKNLG